MSRLSDTLWIGTIVKAQGIRGEVKVKLYTDDEAHFETVKRLRIACDGGEREYAVEAVRAGGGMAVVKLAGIDTRDDAEAMRAGEVYLARKDAAQPPEGRYYLCDLIGCAVVDEAGVRVGEVHDVLQNSGADIYVIRTGQGDVWLVGLPENLLQVDTEAGLITIRRAALLEVDEGAY